MGDTGYSSYLRSAHWMETRRAALERAGYRCQLCGRRDDLQVHHNTYANLGAELERDLVVLCDPCHRRHSESLPPPPTCIPRESDFHTWYPGGREGEIIRALESEADPLVVRALLAEKIALDRGRT